MLKRVTFIFAAVLTLTLSAVTGCVRTFDPTPKQGKAISFGAGSSLLVDGMPSRAQTRGAELKEAFDQASEDVGAANADSFFVWGTKTVSTTRYAVFTGQAVILTSLGANDADPADDVWDYAPHRFWDTNASQYEFLGISGSSSVSNTTCNPAASGHLTAHVTHDITESQRDLMAAGARRTDGSQSKVNLTFSHILSAVLVVIYNDSPTIPVQLNAYRFRNICIRATGIVEQNGASLTEMTSAHWTEPAYSSGRIMGCTDTTALTARTYFPDEADWDDHWDLMIPQSLATYGDYIPQMYLDYEYDQVNPYSGQEEHNHSAFPINLEEITIKNSDRCITSWEPGKKYLYEVHIRLGGGVNVNVSVTDWEEVLGETPGITL